MKYICKKCNEIYMVDITSFNINSCMKCGNNSFVVEQEMFGQ